MVKEEVVAGKLSDHDSQMLLTDDEEEPRFLRFRGTSYSNTFGNGDPAHG